MKTDLYTIWEAVTFHFLWSQWCLRDISVHVAFIQNSKTCVAKLTEFSFGRKTAENAFKQVLKFRKLEHKYKPQTYPTGTSKTATFWNVAFCNILVPILTVSQKKQEKSSKVFCHQHQAFWFHSDSKWTTKVGSDRVI